MTSGRGTGAACASTTSTPSSPTMTPVFGLPSVVKAQQFRESLRKLVFFGFRSAWEAKLFMGMGLC